jgi:hypothetical protein
LTLKILSKVGSSEIIESIKETDLSFKLTTLNNAEIKFKINRTDKAENTLLAILQLNSNLSSYNTEIYEIEVTVTRDVEFRNSKM